MKIPGQNCRGEMIESNYFIMNFLFVCGSDSRSLAMVAFPCREIIYMKLNAENY